LVAAPQNPIPQVRVAVRPDPALRSPATLPRALDGHRWVAAEPRRNGFDLWGYQDDTPEIVYLGSGANEEQLEKLADEFLLGDPEIINSAFIACSFCSILCVPFSQPHFLKSLPRSAVNAAKAPPVGCGGSLSSLYLAAIFLFFYATTLYYDPKTLAEILRT